MKGVLFLLVTTIGLAQAQDESFLGKWSTGHCETEIYDSNTELEKNPFVIAIQSNRIVDLTRDSSKIIMKVNNIDEKDFPIVYLKDQKIENADIIVQTKSPLYESGFFFKYKVLDGADNLQYQIFLNQRSSLTSAQFFVKIRQRTIPGFYSRVAMVSCNSWQREK